MKTGTRGVALIKQKEEFMARAYICPAGKLTIGYGHVILANEKHLRTAVLTEPQASALLAVDLDRYERAVLWGTKAVKLNQNQFDACVTLCYNIGEVGFESSTLAKHISARASEATIRAAWAAWNKATVNGKKVVMNGLVTRRKQEANLYFNI